MSCFSLKIEEKREAQKILGVMCCKLLNNLVASVACALDICMNMQNSQNNNTATQSLEIVKTYIFLLCFFKASPQSALNDAESNAGTPMPEFQVSIKIFFTQVQI